MRLFEREEYLSDHVPWLDWLDHRRDAVTTVTQRLPVVVDTRPPRLRNTL